MGSMYPDSSPASSGTSGTIKLAGDLGGTADSPSVVKVVGTTPGAEGLLLLATSTAAAARGVIGLVADSISFLWQGFVASASTTGFYPIGTATFTTSGSNTGQILVEGAFARITTGATSGNSMTWLSPPSFAPLMSTTEYRYLHFEVRFASTTHARVWLGLFGTTPTSVDTIGTQCLGWRYSTVASDAGFVPITCDGAGNQSAGTALTGTSTTTTYHLWARIRTGSFEVATSPYGPWTAQNTNLPTASTPLVLGCFIATTAAGSQTFDIRLMLHGESTL